MKVPKCMSTQHPDNVNSPFFAQGPELGGEDEVKETFYAYSHLGCDEQLWDCEGKEADQFIVRKLLANYEQFFRRKRLGRDVFLTMRVPNPDIERSEAKVLLETLESIPRSSDIAREFYGDNEFAPIFEVAFPMTTGPEQVIRVSRYYKKFVAGRSSKSLLGKYKVCEWMGEFFPKEIRVIPLFENAESILSSPKTIRSFVAREKVGDYVRAWFARSDPALNYGSIATVLMLKVAMCRLHREEKRLGIDILPILGCGSAPFRGNLYPGNVGRLLTGYPSVQTFTIQSAFKYDYPLDSVRDGIRKLGRHKRRAPHQIDSEAKVLGIADKSKLCYAKEMKKFFPAVVPAARIIPQRRRRKLHIGLFGYSRGKGSLKLPRAIPFCAAFYSFGFPPELMGLSCLSGREFEAVERAYPSVFADLGYALRFLNDDNLKAIDAEFYKKISDLVSSARTKRDDEHYRTTSRIYELVTKKEDGEALRELILRAAHERHFLG